MTSLRAPGLALVLVLASCSHRAAIDSCADDLSGIYDELHDPWIVIDHGTTLEAYPLFADAIPGPALVPYGWPDDVLAAPQVIDLTRDRDGAIRGTVLRRFTRRADACEVRAPARIRSCAHDELEVEVANVERPSTFAPCRPAPPGPLWGFRWRRR